VVAASLAPGAAFADWTGKGEAGVVLAHGNTDSSTANAKLELSTTEDSWKHTVGLDGIYASADDVSTGQRWEAYEQSEHSFSPRNFWFGAGRYEDDRFSGFTYQATLSSGFGHHFIDDERTKLTGTAGVGYKLLETRDTFDDAGLLIARGDTDNEAVFRGTLDLSHGLTDTTKLLNKFLVESGSNNTFLQNDLAIQVKVTAVLALSAGYSVRINTNPPLGFGKTDTLTTLNLVYEFK
jgi:putative salt-induced outer membrane protein